MKGLQQEWRRITEASPCCFLKKKYEEVPLMLRQFVIQTSRRLNMKEGQDYLCEAGLQSLTIAANGDIYPCHMFIPGKYMLLDNIFLGISICRHPSRR